MSVAISSPTAAPRPAALHRGLWVVQILLALAFTGAGIMKTTTPLPALGEAMAWVRDSPAFLPRFIGTAELLGAVGLILPQALRIAPVLTPVAAGALSVVMLLAVAMHASYGEFGAIPVNLVLGGLAAFVALPTGSGSIRGSRHPSCSRRTVVGHRSCSMGLHPV